MRRGMFVLAVLFLGLILPRDPEAQPATSLAKAGDIAQAATASSTFSASDTERLRAELDRASRVRVTGTFGTAELTRPKLAPDGIHFERSRLLKDGAELPGPISLDQVTSISRPRSRVRTGVLAGLFGGALFAIVRESRAGTDSGGPFGALEGISAFGRIISYVAVGGVGGALAGSMVKRWEPIDARR